MNRREFLAAAAVMGTSAVWAGRSAIGLTTAHERRDLYPEGVASGDPDANSVLLWTRYPLTQGSQARLSVEVAEDEMFKHVIATASVKVEAAADWTCRVLVGNLQPSRVYWYRFIDDAGNASRVGRTLTAPAETDTRTVRFAFVGDQEVPMGYQQAYRRMIFEDERASESERLEFVLHLGDYLYVGVWYPEDSPGGMYYGRQLRDVVRYPHGEKVGPAHFPVTLEDYRTIYRAYIRDPDLQDARARWPFVNMWDNGEFVWEGWQSILVLGEVGRSEPQPAQTRMVAANQAWFEYQPARIKKSSGPSLDRFDPPAVVDAPIEKFDEHGLGLEPNNLAAINSLTGYRALKWGRHVELIITDQCSYRSRIATSRPGAKALANEDYFGWYPEEALEALDAGPPAQTILGAEQKAWFLGRLKVSTATWKVWGNTLSTLDSRVDPQNLPAGITKPWPGSGYAIAGAGDYSTAYRERAEIYSLIREEKITGFATLAADRHSFWAGLSAASLPPKPFEPVGVEFVTGSISAMGFLEYIEHDHTQSNHPLRALQLAGNLLHHHGVRACLEYQRTGDIEAARRASNPNLAPHLSFLDLGGHGYAIVRASDAALECEFVCIPRPVEQTSAPDGGPLRYRVVHRVQRWQPGEAPRIEQRVLEGNPVLSL